MNEVSAFVQLYVLANNYFNACTDDTSSHIFLISRSLFRLGVFLFTSSESLIITFKTEKQSESAYNAAHKVKKEILTRRIIGLFFSWAH